MNTHRKLNKQALKIIRMNLEADSGERLQDMNLNAAMLLYDIALEMVGDKSNYAIKDVLGDDAWQFVKDMIDGGQCEFGHSWFVQGQCPTCFESHGEIVPVTPLYVEQLL